MDFKQMQSDMQDSFIFGAPGVLVSGMVWVTAGIVAMFNGFQASIIFFFFAGMSIYPLSALISRVIHKSQTNTKDNPLAKLAMEGTVLLFVGLFLAYTFARSDTVLFYPIMLLIIGARYLTFQTIYGLKTYWVLGGVLLALGACMIAVYPTPPHLAAIFGGVTEIIFSAYLFRIFKKN